MSGVLVVAEARRGELRDVTFELIGAARGLGSVSLAVIDSDPSRYRDRLAVDGVDSVLAVATPNEHFEPHVAQRALEGLIEQERPSVVVLGHTIDSLGFAPAVAARGAHGFASDVTRLSSSDGEGLVVGRSAYGGKLEAELDFPGRDTVLLLLRVGTFEPAEVGGGAQPEWREVSVELGEPRSQHVDFREVDAGDVDITKADFLLSVGRGIEDKDNLEQFEELADRMGATLSVSRPLVDAGWVSNARQVGQSGKTVKPKVYLALGISGAVQHLAGMKNADTIIAVNSDPEAPIFNVAHYGVVADLFDIAGQLEQQSG